MTHTLPLRLTPLALLLVGCPGDVSVCDDPLRDGLIDEDGDGFAADLDCDDTDPDVYPGAPERCGRTDHDCDGIEGDEDHAIDRATVFADADRDGFGDPRARLDTCEVPDGHVANDGDCDDTRADVHPKAVDVADGYDNDCDGMVSDEECVEDGLWRTETFTPASVSDLGAWLVSGDREFGGFGPQVGILVSAHNQRSQVDMRVYLEFRETAPDWSAAILDEAVLAVYAPPEGCEIASIQVQQGVSHPTGLVESRSYVDETTTHDVITGDTLIDELVVSADQVGLDIGYGTGVVSLSFQPLTALLYCP